MTSSKRILARHLRAKVEVIDADRIQKFRKDFLMLAKAAERLSTFTDLERVRSAFRIWGEKFEFYVLSIKSELESRAREGEFSGVPVAEGQTRPSAPDVNFLLGHMAPIWYLNSELRSFPSVPELVGRSGDPWRPPEEVTAKTISHFMASGSSKSDAENYLAQYPAWSREEAETSVVTKWKVKATPWLVRLRKKARDAWKWLDDLIAWSARAQGGSREVGIRTLERENLTLEGFQMTFVGWDESFFKEQLSLLRESLRRYRKLAAERAPILLKTQLPLIVHWTTDPRDDKDSSAYYSQDKIVITTWAFNGGTGNVVRMLAHEMGHHIYRTYLRPDAKAAWTEFLRGSYKELDLYEALDTLKKVGAGYVIDDELRDLDPILFLQLNTLVHDPRYSDWDLWSVKGIEKHLAQGKDSVVRVPIHPITGYAGKNPEEALCEAIGMYVAYGPKAVLPVVRQMLRGVLPGGALRVTASRPR